MKTADKLAKFRKQCEHNSGTPVAEMEVPLVNVLFDICKALGLTRQQRRRVLGRKSTILLEDIRTERCELVERQ